MHLYNILDYYQLFFTAKKDNGKVVVYVQQMNTLAALVQHGAVELKPNSLPHFRSPELKQKLLFPLSTLEQVFLWECFLSEPSPVCWEGAIIK